MRLRTRLTLAFLVVALVPAGVILSLTWFTVEIRFQEEFKERLDNVGEGIRSDLEQMGERIQQKVKGLTESEEVERVLVDMVRGSLDRRMLIPQASLWMQAWDLDLLTVLDGTGTVLSSGHLPARYGSRDEARQSLSNERNQKATIHEVQVLRGGRIENTLAMEVGTDRVFGQMEILVVGGKLLDENYVAHLESLSGAEIQIVAGDGRIVAGGSAQPGGDGRAWVANEGVTYRRTPLPPDRQGEMAAHIVAGVSETKLKDAQWRILVAAVGAAVAGVFFSCLLGLVISRRIVGPVDALVVGARSVAHGNLEQRVPEMAGAEIGELVRTFNGMIDDLSAYRRKLIRVERVAAWQEIARRIAHEIKNPLSPIQMSIETLRKTYASKHPAFEEIFEESTKAILEEVARLKRIVSEFSDFARLPKPKLEVEDLNSVVEHTVSLFRSEKTESRLIYLPSEEPLMIALDREQIGRVLANLLSNAFHAIGAVGRVEVCTGRNAGRVFLRVSDNGSGMDGAVLEKVFTPYFTTRKDGTGLGLAIVQRIVEEHGAAIEIESAKDHGTTATVFLRSISDEHERNGFV